MCLIREPTGAAKQTWEEGLRQRLGLAFFLPGEEMLLHCGVRARNQTQVGLDLGITDVPCLFRSRRGIEEPLITSISSLKMVKK